MGTESRSIGFNATVDETGGHYTGMGMSRTMKNTNAFRTSDLSSSNVFLATTVQASEEKKVIADQKLQLLEALKHSLDQMNRRMDQFET